MNLLRTPRVETLGRIQIYLLCSCESFSGDKPETPMTEGEPLPPTHNRAASGPRWPLEFRSDRVKLVPGRLVRCVCRLEWSPSRDMNGLARESPGDYSYALQFFSSPVPL